MARKKELPYTLTDESIQNLKDARINKGLTQEQLAENIDRTRATYLRLENGQSNVLSETLRDVCRELDLTPHVYVTAKGEKEINIRKMMQRLKEQDEKIAELEKEIAELEKDNAKLNELNELLKENRELRKK